VATRGPGTPIARWASALAALLLAGEAAVHVEQFATLFDGVRWIGPLFLLNAGGCLLVIAGLSHNRSWALSALAGVAISVLALVGLIVSYGVGLLGWQESGLSTAIGIAVACELGAVIALSAGLFAAATATPKRHT
jgi:hypothetical protein